MTANRGQSATSRCPECHSRFPSIPAGNVDPSDLAGTNKLPKGKVPHYSLDLMRFRAVLTAAALSGRLLVSVANAAGPDDLYLDAYRLIQEGDQFSSAGQPEVARQRYADAEANLKKIQTSYPEYNKNAVEFRLEYIRDHAKGLPGPKPETGIVTSPKPA